MKKLLFALLLIPAVCHADYKANRDFVGKSSASSVSTVNVAISTSPSFVKAITLSGVEPSTVVIYNTQLFSATASSRTYYWPGGSVSPVTLELNMVNSSGTFIHKIGLGNVVYTWDWLVRPFVNPLNEQN
jgi:hypothetical protein